VGDQETADACRAILEQEKAMAKWLHEHLPEVTRAFLARSADPRAEAKR
jgi:ferritin-like metal-binding protein YciE